MSDVNLVLRKRVSVDAALDFFRVPSSAFSADWRHNIALLSKS